MNMKENYDETLIYNGDEIMKRNKSGLFIELLDYTCINISIQCNFSRNWKKLMLNLGIK